ncbi:MAG TPA: GNAT family N-acetyltransferase [Burkholderiales bacterium]
MTWNIYPARALLERYAGVWDRLQRDDYDSHPLFDMRFIGPALSCFGADDDRVRLAVETESGRPKAMALVEHRGLGRWQLFLPSQIPLGPLMLRTDATAEECGVYLDGLLAALPGYAWTISLLKQDPAYCIPLNVSGGAQGEWLCYGTTVSIAVKGTFSEYWESRSKNLRAKMRRLLGRLDQEGGSFVEIRERSDMASAIEEHGRLESAGWKGQRGTAIEKDNVQGVFYREVLERFAARGEGRVFQLRLNGRVIASQLAVQQKGVLVLLKTAHDESYAPYSPGRTLDYLMLRHLFDERELRAIEFYTKASTEDMRWSTSQRDIYHFNYFRSPLLRSAAKAARRVRHAAPGWAMCIAVNDNLTPFGIS